MPAGDGYSFELVASPIGGPTHEALGRPSGYVIVPARLMVEAKNESELAGMLARAMVRSGQQLRPVRTSAATVPLFFAISDRYWTRDQVPRSWAEAQRPYELEADREAARALAAAGYDPRALAAYIERVQPPALEDSPLPPRAERLENLSRAVHGVAIPAPPPSGEFERIQEETRRALARLGAVAPKPPTLRRPGDR
jgi:hypothetical protein